jgi:hypothetical protein
MLESFYATKQGDTQIAVYPNNKRTLVEVINGGVKEYPGFDYYSEINDDHVFITPGWDVKLIDTIERNGGFGFAWGRDGQTDNPNLPTAVVMSANMIKALGFFMPPIFKHTFCDNALKDIGNELKIMFYNREVLIEHRHCLFGKAEKDEHYQYVMSRESMQNGKRAYDTWAAEQKAGDIERLKNAIKDWRANTVL